MILGREPVAIAAAFRALILLAVSLGLHFTPEQIAVTMLAIEAVLALLVRAVVTPVPLGTPAPKSRG